MKSTKTLILAFVAILIGVVLIGVIAGEIQPITKLTSITDTFTITREGADNLSVNETIPYTLTKGTVTGTFREDDSTCSISTLIATNTSDTLTAGAVDCSTGDYNYTASQGYLQFCNSSLLYNSIGNASYVAYSYCPDDYVSSTWGRTSLNLVPGFFALALLIFGAYLIFKVAKEEGFII